VVQQESAHRTASAADTGGVINARKGRGSASSAKKWKRFSWESNSLLLRAPSRIKQGFSCIRLYLFDSPDEQENSLAA
jgi:hypothetical protein